MNNMKDMMKAAQKMQERVHKLQEELNARTVEATSGGGMVTAVVTGAKSLQKLTIQPAAVDPSDVEMLEDLILVAVNEALRKAEDMVNAEMSKVTAGLNLPRGMF
ncbi:MAG: Nucleoid-associated protein [Firmicutes bacterium]|nr:Nucleoid-associated protein [candidate division NPL-UPA2 bacterium]MBT9154528.1 Nucleoid-associated protein [candidate division NPL-UPA2 bacterium]MBT9155799.1 Nucleoid-associated protein [candidate division NPL-UPA2 bacterium]